jgi:membrane fusion protein, multidrug efflux system
VYLARVTISRTAGAIALAAVTLGAPATARAQQGGAAPAVGVLEAAKRPMTEANEYLGRIKSFYRVAVTARVTAFLDKWNFVEGSEVKTGDLLYQLERGPFEADLKSKQAQVAQLEATLGNAKLTTERARILLSGPAGQQSTYDAALANQASLEAQVRAAQAQVDLSKINLDYTEIHSPIDGRIGLTAITEGNVVAPGSGTLATIVSQDPMAVTFPVSVREAQILRDRYATHGGFQAVVIRIRLPNGRLYDQVGQLNFANNTIDQGTDTLLLRGTIPNPRIAGGLRELSDNEFVDVLLEGVQPVEVLAIPRSAVLSDQQGDFVFVLGAGDKAEQRRIKLGQSTPTIAAVTSGLAPGDKVIVEGLQRVKPGEVVVPGPASATIQSSMKASAEGEAGSIAKSTGGSP